MILYGTYSRGAYLALAIAVIVIIGLKLRSAATSRGRRLRVSTALLALVVGATLYAAWSPSASVDGYAAGRLREQSYDHDRFELLRTAAEESVTSALGQGPGTFGERHGANPHNLFLGKAVDAGVLAALLLVGVLVTSIRHALRAQGRQGDWVMGLVAATLIGQLVVSGVIYSHHWRHMYLLCALALGRSRMVRTQANRLRTRLHHQPGHEQAAR
jgi:MFS family permease